MNRAHRSIDVNNRNGFSIAAKTLLLVAVVTAGSVLAVGRMSAHAPDATLGIREPAMPAAPVVLADPDAELRPWLREAQPPTF